MLATLLHDGPHGGGFTAGLLHPLTGLDHCALALAAGLLAARLPRPARGLLLAAFLPGWLLLHGGPAAFLLGSGVTTLLLALGGLGVGLLLRPRAAPSA